MDYMVNRLKVHSGTKQVSLDSLNFIHSVCINSNGDWLMDYMVNRLKVHSGTKQVSLV